MNLSKIIFKKRYNLLNLIELRSVLVKKIVSYYNPNFELYQNINGITIETSYRSFLGLKKPIFVITKNNFDYSNYFSCYEIEDINHYIGLIKQLNNELLEEDIPYIKKYKREQKLKKIIYEK